MENKINIFCVLIIVTAVITFIGLKILEKKIGGNATNGYCNGDKYIVADMNGVENSVSKMCWKFDYYFSITTFVICTLAGFSIFYLFIRYIAIPIWKGTCHNIFKNL